MITRQTFLRIVTVAASSVAAGAAACGDSETTDDGTDGPSCGKVNATISANHSHVLGIAPGDVTAGVEKTYDIKGSAAHSHMVTVTAEQFQQLAAGQTITIESTRAGAPDHLHSCSIICAEA